MILLLKMEERNYMSECNWFETCKITPWVFPAFTLCSWWKQRCFALVEQWLTNHPWGEGCTLTYFQAVSFAQNLESSISRSQWLSLPVLRKPMSFHLADEICARELACCCFPVNEPMSHWLELLRSWTSLGNDRLNTWKVLRHLHLCFWNNFCIEIIFPNSIYQKYLKMLNIKLLEILFGKFKNYMAGVNPVKLYNFVNLHSSYIVITIYKQFYNFLFY